MIPLWKDVVVDLDTPVSAFLKLKKAGSKFLLESVEKGEKLGRYSFIGLNPSPVLRINNNTMILNDEEIYFQNDNFLEVFLY